MTGGFRRSDDPVDLLAQRISDLEAKVRDLQAPKPFMIPILAADPDAKDPTNLWLMPDGRMRGRHLNTAGTGFVIREWVPTSPGTGTSGTAAAPPTAAPTTRETAFAAQWSRSYRGTGAARTDSGVQFLYYGQYDSFNGRNRSLIGFDYAAIATALSGSTVLGVKLLLQNLHTYWNSGGFIHFGIHNFTSMPGSWAGGGIPRSMILREKVAKTQTKYVNLPLDFAVSIRDGWGKGIALESPSNDLNFYGYAAGVGSGYTLPTLYITYAK